MVEQKNDFEDEMREKDLLIKKLRKELEESNLNLNELKESLKILVKNNRQLEVIVRKLLEQKKEVKMEFEYVTIDLTRDNKGLKTQNQTLKDLNDDLQKQLQDLNSRLLQKAREASDKINLEGENDDLKRENRRLQDKVNNLENQKEYYEKKNVDLDSKLKKNNDPYHEDEPKYNHSDFLKCMYGQAHFIEQQQQFFNNQRTSYKSYT